MMDKVDKVNELKECRDVLKRLLVPAELLNIITIPVLSVVKRLEKVIKAEEQEREGDTNADDTIQRTDADPAKPDAGR